MAHVDAEHVRPGFPELLHHRIIARGRPSVARIFVRLIRLIRHSDRRPIPIGQVDAPLCLSVGLDAPEAGADEAARIAILRTLNRELSVMHAEQFLAATRRRDRNRSHAGIRASPRAAPMTISHLPGRILNQPSLRIAPASSLRWRHRCALRLVADLQRRFRRCGRHGSRRRDRKKDAKHLRQRSHQAPSGPFAVGNQDQYLSAASFQPCRVAAFMPRVFATRSALKQRFMR